MIGYLFDQRKKDFMNNREDLQIHHRDLEAKIGIAAKHAK